MDTKTLPAIIDLFVYSDLFNLNSEKAMIEWLTSNVPFFNENYDGSKQALFKPVADALIELAKPMDIQKVDITAIFTEVGANVDEENGAKMRALVGRWVNNSHYEDVIGFLLGYLKLAIYSKTNANYVAKELGLLEEDASENLIIPFAICVIWCLLIETNIAVEKGMRENANYMPETLKQVIAIDKLSRITEKHWEASDDAVPIRTIFRTFMDILINNHNRYAGKVPHQSEITYMIVAKNGYKRVGGDPTDFVYRTLDVANFEDWGLFTFLTDNIG